MFRKIISKIVSRNMSNFSECEDAAASLAKTASDCQLYVHIPFCEELCPYCSFHRVPFCRDTSKRYFSALRTELRRYHELGFVFSDVYVGGGTPTVAPDELGRTLSLIRSLFPVRNISVETNPNGLLAETLAVLKGAGVARLSVGVQSFDDELLRKMARYEKYGSGKEIQSRLARVQGMFPTLNVDMIFNLPNQTMSSLKRDMDILLKLGVDQVSFYPLMAAPGVKAKIAGAMGVTDGSQLSDYYKCIVETFRHTYRASSSWCFSRNDAMIDEYIINHDNYLGAGSGAFSYVDGVTYAATFSIEQYIERIERGLTGITHSKPLSLKQRMRYDFMVKLFGLSLGNDYVLQKYGKLFYLLMLPEITAMRLMGALRYDNRNIRLTERGMYLWVIMMTEFFNSVNAFREQMRKNAAALTHRLCEPEG